MKKLILSYFKKTFKEKKLFIIIFAFVFFLFFFVLAGFSVFDSLNQANKNNSLHREELSTYYSYTSKGKDSSNGKNGITPLSAFSEESLDTSEYGNKYVLPSVSLTNGDVFLFDHNRVESDVDNILTYLRSNDFDNDNSSKKFFYFNVFNYLKKGESDFAKLFSKTNISREINAYFYYFVRYFYKANNEINKSEITKKLFENCFFDKNMNGVGGEENDGEKPSKKSITISAHRERGNEELDENGVSELYEKGINSIGQIINLKIVDGDNSDSILNYHSYFFGQSTDPLDTFKTIEEGLDSESVAGLIDAEIYNNSDTSWFDNIFLRESNNNIDLFTLFLNEISSKSNFTTKYSNQFIYSNYKKNLKILMVDQTPMIYNNTNLNMTNLNIVKRFDDINLEQPNVVVISNRYAQENDVVLGADRNFEIENGSNSVSLTVGATGYDYNQIYPLIFDTDYIPNSASEVTYFLNKETLSAIGKVNPDYIKDNSKLFFQYSGNDFENDFKNLESRFSFDIFNCKNGIKLNRDIPLNMKLRYDAMSRLGDIFLIVFSVIFLIVFLTITSSICLLVMSEIKRKMSHIGILKANGFRNWEISLEYCIKIFLPSLVASIISYPFVIGLQFYFTRTIQPFFEIDLNIDYFLVWFALAILLFNAVLFILVGLFTNFLINKRTIDLIENNEIKKISPLMKLIDKIKIKNFKRRFAVKQFAVSMKKVITLGVVLFIGTFTMTMLTSVPNIISETKDEYYESYNYNLSNDYQETVVNMPLSRYTTYADPLSTDSFFPAVFDRQDGSDKFFVDSEHTPSNTGELDDQYAFVQDSLIFNLLYLKNKHFSLGGLQGVSNLYSDSDTGLNSILNNFSSVILPNIFGTTLSDVSTDWRDNISKLVSKNMPPELLQYWNSSDIRDRFSFDLGATNYNPGEDELKTAVNGRINDNANVVLYGLDNDQKLYDLDISKLKGNEVSVSRRLAKIFKITKNQKLQFAFDTNELQFINANKVYESIDPSWFVYKPYGDNNDIPIDQTDLTKYTYLSGKYKVGYGQQYYFDAESCQTNNGNKDDVNDTNCYKPFYNVQDIVLKMPKAKINPSLFGELFIDENNNYLEEDENNYYIHLFDWSYEKNEQIMSDEMMTASNTPLTWYTDALNQKFDINDSDLSFFAINDVKHNEELVVKNIVNIYDKNLIFSSREKVNQLIGVDTIGNDSNWGSYFNGISSNNSDQKDSLLRVGFVQGNADMSLQSLKSLQIQTDQSDLLMNKLTILDSMYNLFFLVSIPFILITLIISAISISMIANQFVSQFAKTIYTLKIIGYSNREIHNVLLRIIAPLSALSILIGAILPGIIFFSVEMLLLKFEIVLPIIISWQYMLISLIISVTTLTIIYSINYRNVISKSMQEHILF